MVNSTQLFVFVNFLSMNFVFYIYNQIFYSIFDSTTMQRKCILKHEKTIWMKKKSKRHILSPRKKKHLKRLTYSKRNSFIYISGINSVLCMISSSGISETEQAVQTGITDAELGSGTNELGTSGYESVMPSDPSGITSIPSQLSNQCLTQVPDEYCDNATYCKELYFEYNEDNQEFVESPEVSIAHANQDEQEDLSEVTSDIENTVMDTESQLAINYRRSEEGASITAAGDMPEVSERSYNLSYTSTESCLSPSTDDTENNGQDFESIEDQQTSEVNSFSFCDTLQNTDHRQESEVVNTTEVERESQETGPIYNDVELLPGPVPDYNDVELSPRPANYQQTERGSYRDDRDVNILRSHRNDLSYDINISSCRRLQQNGCFPKCWICFNGQAVVENTPCCCVCYCLDCAPGMIKCALCHQDIHI